MVGWPASEETLSLSGGCPCYALPDNTSANGTFVLLVARVRAPTTGWLASHRARLFIPCQDPHGASSLIRDVRGEGNRPSKGQRMHVDAAHHIPMPDKRTLGIAAAPDPSL